MKSLHRSLIILLALAASSASAAEPPLLGGGAPPAREPEHAKVELVARDQAARPDRPFWVGLSFRLEKGWHIYWINPGDSGQAPRIKWELPAGVTAGEIQWPVPERMSTPPIMSYGYEGEVLLPIELRSEKAPAAGARELALRAEARWLVCREICLPGRARLALDLPLAAAGAEPTAGPQAPRFEDAFAHLPHPFPAAWKAAVQARGDQLELRVSGAPALGEARFFPLDSGQVDNMAAQTASRSGTELRLALRRSEQLTEPLSHLRGLLVTGRGEGYRVDARVSRGSSLAWMLLLAFAGGLLLNFMPCVFPVLSIKVLSLLKAEPGTAARTFRKHAVFYTLGILVSFWVLVGALWALRAGGRQLGWGFQLQSPGFLAFLALVLFFLSLNLLGVFEITSLFGVRPDAGGSLAARQGASGSFFTGVLATVVSTPCSAPFMGTATGFALAEGLGISFLIFTFLGLGLAAPYAALGLHPAWARLLPKPGRWMETLKQVLAFPVLATVIWLLWVFALQTGPNALALLLTGLLAVGFAAWALGRFRGAGSMAAGLVAWLLAAGLIAQGVRGIDGAPGAWASNPGGAGATAEAAAPSGEIPSVPYSRAKLDELRRQGKPVFVDFTAAWCVSCKVNELVVLRSSTFRQKMEESGTVLMKGDWTSYDPAITEALTALGRSGVPVYALYRPGQGDAPPLLLSEFLTLKEAVAALDTLRAPSSATQTF